MVATPVKRCLFVVVPNAVVVAVAVLVSARLSGNRNALVTPSSICAPLCVDVYCDIYFSLW
jgi:hypothetical protein